MTDERILKAYEQERRRILELDEKIVCDRHNPVFGEGSARARIMLIGEAPGKFEAMEGRPFVGKAGKQLDELLESVGVERKELFITNAVKYRPMKPESQKGANRTPTLTEIKAALSVLAVEIECVRPCVVVTLGNTPLTAVSLLWGEKVPKIGDAHGRCIECGTNKLFPLYHPASAIYNMALLDVMKDDIIKLNYVIKELL